MGVIEEDVDSLVRSLNREGISFEDQAVLVTDGAEKLLGWKPKISLQQGLVRTITWFQRKNV